MKAIFLEEHGALDVLQYGDFSEPPLEAGQVRLRVLACSLNYHDVFTRRGMPGIKVPLPMIPGCDCAGEVVELADDVAGWSVGDRVLVDPVERRDGLFRFIGDNALGAYAETVVVGASTLIPLPNAVTPEQASCLPVAYGTSQRMILTRGRLQEGESILILGASGGVGTSSLLLAKMLGAHVVAAAGSDDKCARLRELGADETINYTTTDFARYCRERTGGLMAGGGYDVVVNFTGGDTWAKSLRCVKRGGRLLTCGATAGFDPPTDLRYIWTAEMDIRGSNGWTREGLVDLLEMVASGRLDPVIDRVVPLEEGIDAHRALEERTFLGKIVLTPPTTS
ncbi:MAG: zinc-binding dehydrogenase [Thermoanaerobaculia bacterium]|nr:zinc-binding dehydrogenase [Thermoanaerobaculia bacterium]